MPRELSLSRRRLRDLSVPAQVLGDRRLPNQRGEYVGAGLQVVATAGIGDVDALLAGPRVDVLLEDLSPPAYASAAAQILALAEDPQCADRCRAVAREHLSLHDVGIPRYDRLYRKGAGR
jgi:hypothetical protein